MGCMLWVVMLTWPIDYQLVIAVHAVVQLEDVQ